MSHTPNYDAKVQAILDAAAPGERTCALTGEKWMMTDEEIGWYKKFNVPPSSRSPMTRWWVMSSFFLAEQWWWNKHAETGKPLLTFIHPATGLRVLPDKEWYEKDFIEKGRDVDATQPFFPQLRELQLTVPLLSEKNIKEPENSIARFSFGDVNSYFVMGCRSRDSLFSDWVLDEENTSEAWNGTSINRCYTVADSFRLFDCKFVRASLDCLSSTFLFDCRNCEFCFGASNKRNKKYLWWNEQLTKEEWEKRRAEVDFSSREVLQKYGEQFHTMIREQSIWPENFNDQAEGSTGEYLNKVTRVKNGFTCANGVQDCFWVSYATENARDSAFCAGLFTSQDCYGSTNPAQCSEMLFTYNCQTSQNLEYCIQCMGSENCFGCVGLNRKKFCIFNKQYSEQEYWQRVDELKCHMLDRGEYGEFFPVSMSPAYFPDSGAVIYHGAPPDLGRTKLGALDFEPEAEGAMGPDLSGATNMKRLSDIPDRLDDFDEAAWLGVPIYDASMRRRFAFIAPEIQFYKTHRLAPPARHFVGRIHDLIRESNMGRFESTHCAKCSTEITVAFNHIHTVRTVYCKACYLQYLEKNG